MDSSSDEGLKDYSIPIPALDSRVLGKNKQPIVEEVSSQPLISPRFKLPKLEDKWIDRGLQMLPPEKKAAFLEKWKAMEIHELELCVERSGLIHELANLILEARKKT